jgi:sugar-specific transcriptional regulator TrmB
MDLVEIGLNKSESSVFKTLVRLGKASATVISRESGVPDSKVYKVLGSLERKGLVRLIPEKFKMFVSSNPEVLKSMIKNKINSLSSLNKEVDTLKHLYSKKDQEPVEVSRGKRAYAKMMKELPIPKKSVFAMDYYSTYLHEPRSWFQNIRKNKIDFKVLARLDDETRKDVKKLLKTHKDVKTMPNEGVMMKVIDNSVMMLTFLKANTQLLIKYKPFIKIMKRLFDAYYEKARPVESMS